MGYLTRADIPVHYDLADAFTVCDGYFCSVLGPTDPNRLYWVSATLDPDGTGGGPLVETPTFIPKNVYTWRTMPENLEAAGSQLEGVPEPRRRPCLQRHPRRYARLVQAVQHAGDEPVRPRDRPGVSVPFRGRRASGHAAGGVMGGAVDLHLRAPGDAPGGGCGRDRAGPRHPHRQPGGVGEDRTDRQLRRERRVSSTMSFPRPRRPRPPAST